MTDPTEYPFDPTNPQAELPPKIAAVFAGRYVARAWFHMQQVVLLGDDGNYPIDHDSSGPRKPKTREEIIVWQQAHKELEHERTRAQNSQLRAAKETYTAMRCLTYSLGQEDYSDLREALTRIHGDWVECNQRDGEQTIGRANARFASRRSDPGWSGDDLSHEVLEELAKPFHKRTRDVLRQCFNDRQRRLFEVGEKIEEGLCPAHVRCHLRRNEGAPLTEREGVSRLGGSDVDGDIWDHEVARPPEKPIFKMLADVERHPGELEPCEEWYTDLETVWHRAQFPFDSLQVIRDVAAKHAAGERLDRKSVVQAVSKLHADACKILTEESGYLGIVFDFDEGTVTRTGTDKVENLSQLLRRLFRCLYQAEGEPVTKRSLQECWGHAGLSEKLDELVTPSTFDPAMSRLRKRIKRIGLDFQPMPGTSGLPVEGYKLIQVDNSSTG
jgi:hypothetical protein